MAFPWALCFHICLGNVCKALLCLFASVCHLRFGEGERQGGGTRAPGPPREPSAAGRVGKRSGSPVSELPSAARRRTQGLDATRFPLPAIFGYFRLLESNPGSGRRHARELPAGRMPASKRERNPQRSTPADSSQREDGTPSIEALSQAVRLLPTKKETISGSSASAIADIKKFSP